ncbi:MAG: hypothetical protein ACI4DS_05155 [Eubacterium sp.]
MILYTLDTDANRNSAVKTAMVYLGITVFCVIFSCIYEYFSHGVYSGFMIYMFIFPLLGGVLPYMIIGLVNGIKYPGRVSLNAYNSGIATLTIGSCIQGVLEIYGTTSDYTPVFWITGAILVIIGIISYCMS